MAMIIVEMAKRIGVTAAIRWVLGDAAKWRGEWRSFEQGLEVEGS
jgi:hypothetical protein